MTPARNIDNTLTGQIITLVCDAWDIDRPALVSKSRKRPLPWARSQLCNYLRLYAGHDTISCAALLNRKDESIATYGSQYTYNIRTYRPFADKDEHIKAEIKKLLNKQPAKNGAKRTEG